MYGRGVPNIIIKNFFTSENKTLVTTHTLCETPEPLLRSNINNSILKDITQLKILWTWIKILLANSFIKTLVNIKREPTKVPWKLSLAKKYDLAFKEHCTKIDDICLVIMSFFFSQTDLVLIVILDSFCHSLFTFLPFNFCYSAMAVTAAQCIYISRCGWGSKMD